MVLTRKHHKPQFSGRGSLSVQNLDGSGLAWSELRHAAHAGWPLLNSLPPDVFQAKSERSKRLLLWSLADGSTHSGGDRNTVEVLRMPPDIRHVELRELDEQQKKRAHPRLPGPLVRVIVGLLGYTTALYIILHGGYDPETRRWAIWVASGILGVWVLGGFFPWGSSPDDRDTG